MILRLGKSAGILAGGLLVIFCLTGCGSLIYNPATGRREFIMIPSSEEAVMGQTIHQELLKENKLSTDEQRLARIQTIGQRVSQVSDRQDYEYNFYVIEKDEMNAFTTPGGNIYFYTGLMDKLSTDDQIAAVLAHEIGHCAARHTIKKFQAGLSYSLVSSILLSQLKVSDQTKQLAATSSDVLMNIVFSSYSRKDEHEADRLGVKYLYLSGYDLEAMIDVLQTLERESKGPDVPLILRSHPYIDSRIKEVQKEIEVVKMQYEDRPQ